MWPMCGGEHYVSDDRYIKGYHQSIKRLDEIGIDLNKFLWKQKKKYFEKKINHIICLSNWLKNKTNKSYLFRNNRITFIPPTIDNKTEWKPLSKLEAREKLGLPLKKMIFLFISTNGEKDYRKGYQFIQNYFEKFKSKEILLIKIGNNEEKKFSYEINVNNIKHGDYKNLRKYYSASDMLLSPSVLEAFGQVAIEAASCGIPTVGFKNTGLEDSVSHLKTGYLANYLDQNDFNNGVNFLIKKINNDQDHFYSNCLEFVNNGFTNEKIVDQYMKIYKKILD